MRIKLSITLLLTILGFVTFFEIFEYYNSNKKSIFEEKILEARSITNDAQNNFNKEIKYNLLESEIDLRFTVSESEEEWLRETYFIEKIGNKKNMNNILNLEQFIDIKSLENYKIIYTGDLNNKESKKILLIGDSFVAGFAQERYSLNYHSILKDMMSKNENLNKYEIFSLGKSGSFYSYLTALDTYYNIIKPDIIIFGFLSNDFKPDSSLNESSNYIDCIYGDNNLISIVELIPDRYKISKEKIKKYFCDQELSDQIQKKDDIISYEKLFEKALNRLKNKYNVENVIIANTEPPLLLNYSYPFEQFKKKSINVIYMKETYNLLGYNKKKSLYINPFDWHPAPALSHAYALDIYNYLLENHPHNKNQNTIKKNNSITDITNAVLNKDDNGKIFTIEKIIDVNNYDTLNPENLSITGGRTDLYRKAQHPLQLSFCAKLNRPYDVYEFEKSTRFNITLEKSEHSSLFIINYYFENGKIIEEYSLMKVGSSIEVDKESLGFMIATPYSGCDLEKSIDTGLYKIKINL